MKPALFSDAGSLKLSQNLFSIFSVETKRSKDWTVMKKLNAILTDEWSEEYKKDLEEEAEVDLEDDYLEGKINHSHAWLILIVHLDLIFAPNRKY